MKLSYRSMVGVSVFACLVLPAICLAKAEASWIRIYSDNYLYTGQPSDNTTFNTWFWREDATGTHTFEYTGDPGCTKTKPCVKLTAMPDPKADPMPYINGEMYNNSCARKGIGHPEPQPFDRLPDAANPLVQTPIPPQQLQAKIKATCSTRYPYRNNGTPFTSYASDGWNTTTPVTLYSNPFAYLEEEPTWEWYRDLAFNSPYLAGPGVSQRITMEIKAEAEEGGSRGWGFWNTSMDPYVMQFAWFMELSTPTTNSMLMMTVRGGAGKAGGYCVTPVSKVDPGYSVLDWHQYQVAWHADAVEYYLDGKLLARHTQYVPDSGMAFHNWSDNRNYFAGKTGPANFSLKGPKSNLIRAYTVDEQHHEGGGKVAKPRATPATVCGSFDFPTGAKLKGMTKIMEIILKAYH